jgi:chemotaxis protein MotA
VIVLLPPLVLIFGATFGAALAGVTARDIRKLGSWFRTAFAAEPPDRSGTTIAQIVELATVARKEGLLPLEKRARALHDPFLRRAVQMAVDGLPAEHVRLVLGREMAAVRAEDKVAAQFFLRMGGYAPTIGIVGTVIGLIQVMETLETPERVGPMVAAAFVATLWGVLSANFIWIPISAKITRTGDLRQAAMTLVLEGIAEIQAGRSPRAIRQRLESLLPPSETERAAA